MILVTGGAGFIGSNFVLRWISEEKSNVVNFDKLTSSGNLNNLSPIDHLNTHEFVHGSIRNRHLFQETLKKYQPIAIVHCAADTNTDRFHSHPEHFIQTNIQGTFELLEESLAYWKQLDTEKQKHFRFLHLSSDEVYGPSQQENSLAKESAPLCPSTIYTASKASSDHLVHAYAHTYGLPTIIARTPNCFGPLQFPEKLVPLTIVNALQGKSLPVFGEGLGMRSWLFVWDLCDALQLILQRGTPGEIYNVAPQAYMTNKAVVKAICCILDELKDDSPHRPHANLIKYIKDKPSCESRQPLDGSKLHDLGWQPKESFEESLHRTVHWYLHNMSWVENVISGEYRDFIQAKG